MSKTKVMVEFNLFGKNIDFDKVTDKLEILPTEIKRKEEMKIVEYAEDSWTISTGYRTVSAISFLIEEITDLLKNKILIINEIKRELDINSNIVIVIEFSSTDSPEIVLSNKCIQFAADTYSEIHFDKYFL